MDQVLDDVEFKQFTEYKKALEMRGNLIFQKRKYFFSKLSPVKLKSRDISPENNPKKCKLGKSQVLYFSLLVPGRIFLRLAALL